MFQWLLCWLGFHEWESKEDWKTMDRYLECKSCHKREDDDGY